MRIVKYSLNIAGFSIVKITIITMSKKAGFKGNPKKVRRTLEEQKAYEKQTEKATKEASENMKNGNYPN